MNYLETRAQAEQASGNMPSFHPCRRGNATCCDERDVPTSPADRKLLIVGITSGNISAETISDAKANAADETRNSCPFLGPKRECTVYEYRPLICVATGIGGFPHENAAGRLNTELEKFHTTGEDTGFPTVNASSTMCGPCHLQLNAFGARFPLRGMEIMQEMAKHYLIRGSAPMHQVVQSLPDTR